MSYVL